MKAKIYFRDSKTNVNFYYDGKYMSFYLSKNSVSRISGNFFAELGYALGGYGVTMKQTAKNYLLSAITGSNERSDEFVKKTLDFLSSKNYKDEGRSSGRAGRFVKKGFYSLATSVNGYLEHDFGNGIILYEEKGTDGNIKFVLAITEDVDRIDYAKFKDFVYDMQITDLAGRNFHYQKGTQSFHLMTDYNYESNVGTFGEFVERVKQIALKYYPKKTTIEPPSEPKEPQVEPQKQDPTENRRLIMEEISSLEFAKGYLNPFQNKTQIEEIESEIETLKYLLTTLS